MFIVIRYLIFSLALFLGFEAVAQDTQQLTKHEVNVLLVPETGAIKYTDRITLHNKSKFLFHLASWLRIKKVTLGGVAIILERKPQGWLVKLPSQGTHIINFDISGTIPTLPKTPTRSVDGSAGSGKAGVFLPGYSSWLPDSGNSPIAYKVHASVAKPYRVIGTGRIERETSESVTLSSKRAVELPSLFVGPYIVSERRGENIRIRTYFHPDLENFSEDYLQTSENFIKRFSQEIGPYPYSDFHVISAPLPVGLGFPNLTYVGRRVLALPFMRGRSLAHEVLHNWWGNSVAIDYTDGNWAEGLTTFMADYALAEEKGKDVARQMRLGWLRDFAALPQERYIPVSQFFGKQHDASQVIGYGKVASIFHMLRAEVGQVAFNRALRLFWFRYKFRAAGWSNIKAVFEETAKRDLESFFKQWLERPGAPRISLKSVSQDKRDGQYQLTIQIAQQQPFYKLNVPIRIKTETGVVKKYIKIKGRKKSVTYNLQAKPIVLSVDPNFVLFRQLLPSESPPILRDVTLASSAAVLLATKEGEMHQVATELARRLLDVRGREMISNLNQIKTQPALIIGLLGKIEKIINQTKWADYFARPIAQGTTWAWVRRRANGQPVLIVATKDTASLTAVLRSLQHYRSQSFIVFKGQQAIKKGVWKNSKSALTQILNK